MRGHTRLGPAHPTPQLLRPGAEHVCAEGRVGCRDPEPACCRAYLFNRRFQHLLCRIMPGARELPRPPLAADRALCFGGAHGAPTMVAGTEPPCENSVRDSQCVGPGWGLPTSPTETPSLQDQQGPRGGKVTSTLGSGTRHPEAWWAEPSAVATTPAWSRVAVRCAYEGGEDGERVHVAPQRAEWAGLRARRLRAASRHASQGGRTPACGSCSLGSGSCWPREPRGHSG